MRARQAGQLSVLAGGVLALLGAVATGADVPAVTPVETAALVQGNTEFALDLYGKLRGHEGNLFFSPCSISTALAMTYAGARGATAAQMAEALHLTAAQGRLHVIFSQLAGQVAEAGKANGCQLDIANALWEQAGYGVLEEFRTIVRTRYLGELRELDFAHDAEGARVTINDWVEGQTQGKIQNLIPRGSLGDLTRLVLTNAVYFKALWRHPFRKAATREEPFWLSQDKSVPVPMMRQIHPARYAEFGDCQVLELPYAGDDIAMVILLPIGRTGLPEFEASLTADRVTELVRRAARENVDMSLPRFKLVSQFMLNEPLQAMGMTDAFSQSVADFSGMSDKRPLFISGVIHKAFVDVNEEGTEAAAATGVVAVGGGAPARPVLFRADHPFLFLIRHIPTGSILFIGRVADPRG